MFHFLRSSFGSIINFTLGRKRKRNSLTSMSESEGYPATKKPAVNTTVVVADDGQESSDSHSVAEVIDLTKPTSFSFSQRALNHGDTMCRRLRTSRNNSSSSSSGRHAQSFSASLNRTSKKENSSNKLSNLSNSLDLTAPPRELPNRRTPSTASRPHVAQNGAAHRSLERTRPSVQTLSSSSSAASSGSLCEIVEKDEDVVMTHIERFALPERLVTPDFKKLMQQCRYTETDWLKGTQSRVQWLCEENRKKAAALQTIVKECEESRKAQDDWLSQQTLRLLRLTRKLPTPVEEPYIELDEEEEDVELVETVLPPVTDEIRRRIKSALASPPDTILSDAFRLQVTTSELATLRPREWLSDMIINFYMQLIADRAGKNGLPSAYPMTTFFYPKLLQAGYAGVRRWTRRVDIFAHDLVLVPVHLGQHWCFALINMKEQKVSYFDSMQNPNNECLSQLLQYLVDEAKEKKGVALNVSEWSVENAKNIPVQTNGYDCGVFTCQFAEFLSRGAPLTFTQDKMVYFRERMIFEILEKRLLL